MSHFSPFRRICNSPALSRRISNSIYVNKQYSKGDLKEEGGITKDEVVAFGEYDVLKEEVLPFRRICNSPALSRRISNSIYVNKQYSKGGLQIPNSQQPNCKFGRTE